MMDKAKEIIEMRVPHKLSEHRRKRLNKIPVINFDSDMDVKIWPPFSGALIRMQVNSYSIYLDVNSELGYFGESGMEPYREIYDGNECERFAMDDVKGLLDFIRSLPKRDETIKA